MYKRISCLSTTDIRNIINKLSKELHLEDIVYEYNNPNLKIAAFHNKVSDNVIYELTKGKKGIKDNNDRMYHVIIVSPYRFKTNYPFLTPSSIKMVLMHEYGHLLCESDNTYDEEEYSFDRLANNVGRDILDKINISLVETTDMNENDILTELDVFYYLLPIEKAANDKIGINQDDMIYMHHRKYPSRELYGIDLNVLHTFLTSLVQYNKRFIGFYSQFIDGILYRTVSLDTYEWLINNYKSIISLIIQDKEVLNFYFNIIDYIDNQNRSNI